jgi:putative transposase
MRAPVLAKPREPTEPGAGRRQSQSFRPVRVELRNQRSLSRKVQGSDNRKKAKLKVAKLHAKISDTRRDTLQKFTTKIIRENQAIFVEGLNVAGMLKNHNLARHIGDAAFAEIFRELEYKAEWYGRTYHPLDRFFPSSKLCSSCGHLLSEKHHIQTRDFKNRN